MKIDNYFFLSDEPGGGWKQTLKSNGPIAFMVAVVVLGHVAWRKFQDTDALQGRGVEYPHYKVRMVLIATFFTNMQEY